MRPAPVLALAAATAASAAPTAAIPPASLHCSASDLRDCPVRRWGTSLYLNGTPWKAVGPNIYWLGLDENVTPPAGEPFYAPLKASYPTKGRVVEAIDTVVAMGGTMARAHTLGVSTGNPLSLWPAAREKNERAFEIIDWAVAKARERGVRLMVPLTDNYVRDGLHCREERMIVVTNAVSRRITITEARLDRPRPLYT
jgi:mannan endo-1,4-beta-mannosidase